MTEASARAILRGSPLTEGNVMVANIRRNAPSFLDIKSLHNIIDSIDHYPTKIFEAARWYALNGVKIVPFKMGSGYPKGLSQRHATDKLSKIEEWWAPDGGRFSGYAIAMAHGGQSGFCAVDLDVKDADGINNLTELQAAHGDYTDSEGEGLQTLMAFTPSGGRHLIFKYHPEIISNAEKHYPGIDTRGGLKRNPVENGGITFLEPSVKEAGGKPYRWDESCLEIKDFPQWLVDVLNGRNPSKSGQPKLQDSYVQSSPGKHGDGRDRNIYMDILSFIGAGYSEEQIWGLMPQILERMYPPDEAMVRRKIESALSSDVFKKAEESKNNDDQIANLNLVEDKDGRLVKCVVNLDTILQSAYFQYDYGDIVYDDFTQSFLKDGKPLASAVDWSVGIQLWISRKFKLDFSKTDIRDRVEFAAYDKDHVNIAREYMLTCASTYPFTSAKKSFWGSGRAGPGPAFERLCTEVLDLSNPNLHSGYNSPTRLAYEGFLWFWLQGVAARACVPGCKVEIMLNIFGSQGLGKSLFFRGLCPDPTWFSDSIQDTIVGGGPGIRDELMKLQAKIIVEMPELNPMKRGGKSADEKFKQFMSAQVDNMRRPYGKDSIDYPRTCAFGGTSNNRDVYRDPTGSRRFLSIDHGDVPIRVGDRCNGVMNEIRDQLWGEVVCSFKPGELDQGWNILQVSIPPQLRNKQAKINLSHTFEEVGVQDVLYWMSDKSRVTWEELVTFARGIPGMRDAKESAIMNLLRRELSNDRRFEFKKRVMRQNEKGEKEKVNCWVNVGLQSEQDHKPGTPTPPHWSLQESEKDAEY